MNKLFAVLALTVAAFAGPAHAATPAPDAACEAQAAEKKLSGAAKTSFVKKCTKDAGGSAAAACDAQAAEKKLAGAAKNSFVKKCVSDAAAK